MMLKLRSTLSPRSEQRKRSRSEVCVRFAATYFSLTSRSCVSEQQFQKLDQHCKERWETEYNFVCTVCKMCVADTVLRSVLWHAKVVGTKWGLMFESLT